MQDATPLHAPGETRLPGWGATERATPARAARRKEEQQQAAARQREAVATGAAAPAAARPAEDVNEEWTVVGKSRMRGHAASTPLAQATGGSAAVPSRPAVDVQSCCPVAYAVRADNAPTSALQQRSLRRHAHAASF
jgi:hypothetical protein